MFIFGIAVKIIYKSVEFFTNIFVDFCAPVAWRSRRSHTSLTPRAAPSLSYLFIWAPVAYLSHQLLAALLLGAACLAAADLPIDCRHEDAIGRWIITETSRLGNSSLDCTSLGEIKYLSYFTLEEPNIVTDSLGHTGTWTMVYNQGFEVIHFYIIMDKMSLKKPTQ